MKCQFQDKIIRIDENRTIWWWCDGCLQLGKLNMKDIRKLVEEKSVTVENSNLKNRGRYKHQSRKR